MRVLVTGVAGFIGMHVAQRLLARGDEVIGMDNLNDYYSVALKQARLSQLSPLPGFRFQQLDLADRDDMARWFAQAGVDRVVHLAAQAGVRYSLVNPHAYVDSNLQGFLNVLEACRHNGVEHLVYASSSSVYGGNEHLPFTEHDGVDHPVSLYAATKKANELMAHSYSHLYGIPTTGLRFFTVYGPWGRPDMAPFLFTQAILQGKPIQIFNHGQMRRDFTYIDDIVEGVLRVVDKIAVPRCAGEPVGPAVSYAPYRIFNIGNNQPIPLLDFIAALEQAIGRKAEKQYLPMQQGDVPATYADTARLDEWVGFRPSTPIQQGVDQFIAWYRQFYRL